MYDQEYIAGKGERDLCMLSPIYQAYFLKSALKKCLCLELFHFKMLENRIIGRSSNEGQWKTVNYVLGEKGVVQTFEVFSVYLSVKTKNSIVFADPGEVMGGSTNTVVINLLNI